MEESSLLHLESTKINDKCDKKQKIIEFSLSGVSVLTDESLNTTLPQTSPMNYATNDSQLQMPARSHNLVESRLNFAPNVDQTFTNCNTVAILRDKALKRHLKILRERAYALLEDKNLDETKTHQLLDEFLNAAFKLQNFNDALVWIFSVMQKFDLTSYAKKLVDDYKRNPTEQSLVKRFFDELGNLRHSQQGQVEMTRFMMKLSKNYHSTGKTLTKIWFHNSPLKSMFLHIDESGLQYFLDKFNRVVEYRENNP